MKNKVNFKKVVYSIVLAIAVAILIFNLTSCAGFSAFISSVKGELVGNSYTVWSFDNFGNRVLTINGDKIALDADVDEYGELVSSYIDITIDGREWNHVGGTLVFMQDGVDMITDFQLPDNVGADKQASTGLMGIDRTINNYKNFFGKKTIIVVSSQTGTPIGIFQADKCYTEIPDDLPKTTMLSLDGKLVYVHRANIDIFSADLFK